LKLVTHFSFALSDFVMESQILRYVKEIDSLLDNFEEAHVPSNSSVSSASTTSTTPCTTVHHYHHHREPNFVSLLNPSPVVTIVQPPPQVTIINPSSSTSSTGKSKAEEKKKEKEESESNAALIIGAAVVGVAAAFAGTHVMAKDEYFSFWRSDLPSHIKLIKKICETINTELVNMLDAFQVWSELLERRTKKRTLAKVGTVGSVIGTTVAVAMHLTPFFAFAGVIGATASGCYWYYDSLTSQKNITEKEAWTDLRKSVKKLKNTLENEPGTTLFESNQQPNPSPSAPTPGDYYTY